jgi:hypothetical protein
MTQATGMPLAVRLLREDALGSIDDAYAVHWSRYKKALAAVEALDPERLSGPGQTPLTLMDEEVVAHVHEAWEAGAYIGAAFAKAELNLEVERRICRRCGGYGVDRRVPDHPCAVCGGDGTVPATTTDARRNDRRNSGPGHHAQGRCFASVIQ